MWRMCLSQVRRLIRPARARLPSGGVPNPMQLTAGRSWPVLEWSSLSAHSAATAPPSEWPAKQVPVLQVAAVLLVTSCSGPMILPRNSSCSVEHPLFRHIARTRQHQPLARRLCHGLKLVHGHRAGPLEVPGVRPSVRPRPDGPQPPVEIDQLIGWQLGPQERHVQSVRSLCQDVPVYFVGRQMGAPPERDQGPSGGDLARSARQENVDTSCCMRTDIIVPLRSF